MIENFGILLHLLHSKEVVQVSMSSLAGLDSLSIDQSSLIRFLVVKF